MQSSESYYRSIAGQGASYIGLLLVVYDTLAADLRRAGQAVERADIPARCDAINHALLLLGHLESWTDSLDDPALAASLRQFYTHLRSQALLLQANPKRQPFHDLATLVAETRAAWHTLETLHQRPTPPTISLSLPPSPEEADAPARQRWSA